MNLFETWTDKAGNINYIRNLSTEHIINIILAIKNKKLNCSLKKFQVLVYYYDLYYGYKYIRDYDKKFDIIKDICKIYEMLEANEENMPDIEDFPGYQL